VPETTSSLLTIARVVNGTKDLTETLRLVCRELARLTLAETVAAYLLDVEGKEIRPVAAYHVPKPTLELLTTTALPLAAQGFAQSVFTAGHVAWSDDVQNDPRFAFPLFRVFPHRSSVIIPLSVDGAVAGAFYLVWWQERRQVPEGVVTVLETIGQLVGMLLKNAELARVAETRRRSAEAAEGRHRLLFDRNLAGVLWTRRDGRIVDCNESLARLLGYESRQEVLGRDVRDFYAEPSDREKVLAGIEPGGMADGRELYWRRRDGTPVWLRVNLRATAEGWFEGILIDISSEKRVAQAERAAAELRAVAMLAAATAHEINNPLAVLLGQLTMLARESPESSRTAKIVAAAERIRDIVGRMTNITRIEASEAYRGTAPPMLDIRKSGDARDP
jgi:PAS domain S-box-containing protein